MKSIRFSGAAIRLSKNAAEASLKNLDLVSDAYSQGALSIIELLDAQNSAFANQLRAANASYDFLIDVMKAERAISRFDFFVTDDEQDKWLQKFKIYLDEAGKE